MSYPLFYGKQMDTDNRLLYWEFPENNVQLAEVTGKLLLLKKMPL